MERTLECPCPTGPQSRKAWTGPLHALAGWLLRRRAGRPSKIQVDEFSGHLLKDIGLDLRGHGNREASGRSLMDWPIR